MSDGDYAEMIEIPVSSCEMVVMPKNQKRKNARKKAIEKANKNLARYNCGTDDCNNCSFDGYLDDAASSNASKIENKKKGFDIVSAQIVAIFVLVVAIFVTNIFWEDSGINSLIKSVFMTEKVVESDLRDYKSFTAKLPSTAENVLAENGVMKVNGEGAVYSPCGGVVDSVVANGEKYTLTIAHSDVFKTIIRNVDFAYFEVGDTVYGQVPVAYTEAGGAEVLMYNDNALLMNYSIESDSIIWQS